MSFISIQDVRFSYDEIEEGKLVRYAVDGVSLDVERGEFVAVIGHNGCGKSTLAKQLNAMLLPDSGKVIIDGDDTSVEENTYTIREKIGLVLQNPDNQLVARSPLRSAEGWTRRSRRSICTNTVSTRRTSSPADKSSALPSPAYWRSGRNASCWTSLPPCSTRAADRRSSPHCSSSTANGKILTQGTPEEVFSQVELLKKHRLDVPQSAELAYKLRGCGLKIDHIPLTQADCVAMLGEAMR